MLIYLYIKTHKKTGFKYLGKTSSTDPHKYKGSGLLWRQHLAEHGPYYDTEILRECHSNEELSHWGRYYSKLWNVVEDCGWANRIPETGGGGNHTPERKELFRKQQLGKKKPSRTPEHTENQASTTRGRPNPKVSLALSGRTRPLEVIEKQRQSTKQWCIDNPEILKSRAEKTWKIRYTANYNKYKTILELLNRNLTITEIQKDIKADYATIKKLKTGKHRILSIFPELKQLLSS